MASGIVLVQLRVSRVLYGKLREDAKEADMSLNRFIGECLREGRKHVDTSTDTEVDEDESEGDDE